MYTGIKEVQLSDEELAEFYEGKLKIDALQNEYVLIKNSAGDVVDQWKYDGKKLLKVKIKPFDSQYLDKVKPRNIKQMLFMDLLQADVPLKVVSGIAGSGKSFLSTAWALQEVQKGNFDKLVVVKNNVTVADVPDIGAIPGTELDKIKAHCMFMSDIVHPFAFDLMIQQGKVELAYLGTMRGRSISNSIVLCSEAQNLTTSLVKMIVTRIGEKSALIFDYDLDQIDKRNFEKDNGMMALTESLKGNPLFGMVELDMIERSEIAKLASLIK